VFGRKKGEREKGRKKVQSEVDRGFVGKNGVVYEDERLRKDVLMEAWIGRHWKQVFFFTVFIILMCVIWVSLTMRNASIAIRNQSEVIKNLSTKVLVVTPDGRVANVALSNVQEQTVAYVLRGIFMQNVVISGFDMEDVVDECRDMGKLRKVRKLLSMADKEGRKGMLAFFKSVYSYWKAGKLPEVIYLVPLTEGSGREVIKYQDGRFYYRLIFPVRVFFVQNQVWRKGTGVIDVEAKGRVNPLKGSVDNPWGIQIHWFKVRKYLEK